jgi:hypothetical protein
MAAVEVVLSGRSKDSFMQGCLREIVFLAAAYEVEVFPKHISGITNRCADLLSRWHMDEKYAQAFYDRHVGSTMICRDISCEMIDFIHQW